jgi:NAD(P)-dependent dehydrogenase (short-subunit alcohol dehydrogenase family)
MFHTDVDAAKRLESLLTEKVCIITGAARGIGRATAEEMARQGARVVLADVDETGALETVAGIEAAGGQAAFIRCDVTRSEDVTALMAAAAERFGGIDVLHNNAGVHETSLHAASTVDTLPDEIWDAVMNVNLRGAWWAIKAAVPYLKQSARGPSIVNAASTGGLTGFPNSTAYCASKAGLINLSRATATDLADYGIRCNCYCPGTVRTPMIEKYIEAAGDDAAALSPLTSAQLTSRLGEPLEIAKLVCFLASDDASFINGAVYLIDGGKLAWRGTRAT